MAIKPLMLAAAALALVACDRTVDGTAIANPASTFCTETGGTYALSQADGSGGTCTLPDGRVVDAWDYLRANTSDQG